MGCFLFFVFCLLFWAIFYVFWSSMSSATCFLGRFLSFFFWLDCFPSDFLVCCIFQSFWFQFRCPVFFEKFFEGFVLVPFCFIFCFCYWRFFGVSLFRWTIFCFVTTLLHPFFRVFCCFLFTNFQSELVFCLFCFSFMCSFLG